MTFINYNSGSVSSRLTTNVAPRPTSGSTNLLAPGQTIAVEATPTGTAVATQQTVVYTDVTAPGHSATSALATQTTNAGSANEITAPTGTVTIGTPEVTYVQQANTVKPNEVKNALEAEVAQLNAARVEDEVPSFERPEAPAVPEDVETFVFDESKIARSETKTTQAEGPKRAKSLNTTTTTTDYDSLDRPIRITVVTMKKGVPTETKITTYEYEGDSKTPSVMLVETRAGDENGEKVSYLRTEYREDGSTLHTLDYKYENGNIASYLYTNYWPNGNVHLTYDNKYENGELVSNFGTSYREDGSLEHTYDYNKYENGKKVSELVTAYREDGSIQLTQHTKFENGEEVSNLITFYNEDGSKEANEYKYENGEHISHLRTYYRKDGTKSETCEYKYYRAMHEIGSWYWHPLLTNKVEYTSDGKKPAKEEKYEYDDDNNVTKKTTITYEYDKKGRVTKKTTNIEDAVKNTRRETIETFEYDDTKPQKHVGNIEDGISTLERLKLDKILRGRLKK